jgi:hypothetical protein
MIIPTSRKLPKSVRLSFLNTIEEIVCEEYRITIGQLKSKQRNREYVMARQFCMHTAKECTELSLADIGERYGKDHATVLHAIKTTNNLRETSKLYRAKYDYVYGKILKAYDQGYYYDYVCIHCGMKAIKVKLEVDPNSMHVQESLQGDNFPGYCLDCNRETTIIQEHNYKKYYCHDKMEMETISDQVQASN